MNSGLSLRGATAPDIADIPYIRTAKPRRISPTCLVELFFAAILITIPIRAVTPVRTAVLKRAAMLAPEPEMLLRQRIQPVIDVPSMAPMIIPIA